MTIWPLIAGDWKPLDADESEQFLERLTAVLRQSDSAPPFTQQHPVSNLRALPLSFYPGWLLVEGEAQLSPESVGTFDVLYGPRLLWLIDGKSGVINSLNAGSLPMLPEAGATEGTGGAPAFIASPLAPLEPATTGPDYLRFFCNSVWGEAGPFRLVESPDAAAALGIDADSDAWIARAKPLVMQAHQGDLQGEALVFYGDGMFQARFQVAANGMVEMLDDEPLASGLPVRRHQAPWRDIRVRVAGDTAARA